MIPYPQLFPMDEATLLLGAPTSKPPLADLIHAAYEMLGYALGRVLPPTAMTGPTVMAAALPQRNFDMKPGGTDRIRAAADLQRLVDECKTSGSQPLKGSWLTEGWHRLVFWLQQLIAEWTGAAPASPPTAA